MVFYWIHLHRLWHSREVLFFSLCKSALWFLSHSAKQCMTLCTAKVCCPWHSQSLRHVKLLVISISQWTACDFSWKHKCGASLPERHISQKCLIPYLLRNKSDLASWHSSHWIWSHKLEMNSSWTQDQLEMHLRWTRDELVYVARWTRYELVYVAGRSNTSEEPGNMANPASKHYCRWNGS